MRVAEGIDHRVFRDDREGRIYCINMCSWFALAPPVHESGKSEADDSSQTSCFQRYASFSNGPPSPPH